MNKNNYQNQNAEDQIIKYILNKQDHDFYNEEENKVEKILRIKRIGDKKKEKWKIIEDNKTLLVIDGNRFTNKEKSFLRTSEGFKFLLESYKLGIKSVNALKLSIKDKVSIED